MSIPRGFIEVSGTRINIDHITAYHADATYPETHTNIFLASSSTVMDIECSVDDLDNKIIEMDSYIDGSDVAGPH
jgi:hypothetical protein